ncbi:DotA/TraY family protein [Asaia sp. VD9]|uniref:DotA/TraY family protein n=1 Tax=Asaia sp. VD9 TaxID=3081235 RepID=UPI0030165EFF
MMRLLLLAAAAFLLPCHAWAEDNIVTQVLSTPPQTDWFRHLLSLALPGVGPLDEYPNDPAYAGGKALIAAAYEWVTILMVLGVSMTAWHTIVAMVASAHDGQPLGKDWHTTWTPIRLVLGMGLLAPTIKGGVCMAQVFVVTVALWSASLGNVIWSTYVQNIVSPTAPAPAIPATGAMLRDFAQAEVCWALVHGTDVALASSPGPMPPHAPAFGQAYADIPAQWPTATSSSSTYDTVSVGLGNLWNGFRASIDGGSAFSTSAAARVMMTWDYGLCGQVSAPFAVGNNGDVAVQEFDRARLAAIEQVRKALAASASLYAAWIEYGPNVPQDYAWAGTAALVASFNAEKVALDQAFYNAGQTLVNGTGAGGSSGVSAMQSSISQYGWMTMGMYYSNIAMLQSRASRLAADVPTLSYSKAQVTSSSDPNESSLWPDYNKDEASWQTALNTAAGTWNAGFNSNSPGLPGAQITPDLSDAASAGADGNRVTSLHSGNAWLFRSIYKIIDRDLSGIDVSGKSGSEISQLSAFGNGHQHGRRHGDWHYPRRLSRDWLRACVSVADAALHRGVFRIGSDSPYRPRSLHCRAALGSDVYQDGRSRTHQ